MRIGQHAPVDPGDQFADTIRALAARVGELERAAGLRVPTDYTPGVRNAGQPDVTATISHAKFSVVGGFCLFAVRLVVSSASGGAGAVRVDLPIATADGTEALGTLQFFVASTATSPGCSPSTSTTVSTTSRSPSSCPRAKPRPCCSASSRGRGRSWGS